MPRVSIIMAAYNHERFVGQAIQSVLDQTFQDWELVITDDASPDGTADVVRSFDDPRISFEQFECNRQDSARNRCLERATGEYIAILNSDDEYHPRKLEQQVEWLDAHPENGAVFTAVQMINESGDPHPDHVDGEAFSTRNRSRHEWLRYFFDEGNCLCVTAAMLRGSVLKKTGGFDPLLAQLSDLDMWVRVCLHSELHVLPEQLTRMRLLEGEANASGRRPETIRRTSYEYFHAISHYASPVAVPQIGQIFPELAERVRDQSNAVAAYQLACHATAMPTWHHRMFGMELARELLSDAGHRGEIAAQKSLAPIADFMRLAGETRLATLDAESCIELHSLTDDGKASGQRSASMIPVDRRQIVRLPCPGCAGREVRLRIDPGNQLGIVSLHSVTVRDRDSRSVVHTLTGRELNRSASIHGTACPLPRRGQLRLLSTGHEPQIHLAPIAIDCDGPLDVEVDLKLSTDLSPVQRRVARVHNIRQAIRLRASLVKKWLKRGMAFIWPSVSQR